MVCIGEKCYTDENKIEVKIPKSCRSRTNNDYGFYKGASGPDMVEILNSEDVQCNVSKDLKYGGQ